MTRLAGRITFLVVKTDNPSDSRALDAHRWILMLTPGTVLQNRYRVVRQLGQGGMGTVYEAIDGRLDAAVALKETLFADGALRKQFEREARLLARLHHPALPRVSDHFAEGSGQFLVMQFVEGDDLEALRLRRGGRFPQGDVLGWADQLLDALDYLHTREPPVVHRDIKPQNLKLTARGQIILLDFGLAKGYAQAAGTNPTLLNSFFGFTRMYAPLEQIQGVGTDPRSDLYSLAATLYHLLTGATPPDALSRAAAMTDGDDDPLLPAHQLNAQVSPAVSAVLGKAMSRPRAQRFASAAEMREALSRASAGGVNYSAALQTTVIDLPRAGAVEGDEQTVVPRRGRRRQREARLLKFWEGLLAVGRGRTSINDRLSKPSERSYIVATAGIGGLAYGYNVFKHTSRVELYISRRPASVNKRMFDELLSHKDEIEAAFGDELSWQRLDEKVASRVAYVLEGGHEDEEADWRAIQTRMVDAMVRLERALSPFMPKLMQMK